MGLIPFQRLDPFQKEAIEVLRSGKNLILSAPTGTGKTAVVDHISVEYMDLGRIIYYTSPLKALCNQKFREFMQLFGKERVGLVTGDEVVNEDADLVVMTTEILRNRLQEGDLGRVPDLVVFDEIHYLSDRERGTTWEEAIVLLPSSVQIVGLSATCPNAWELASWIEGIKGKETVVIFHGERAVPLELYGFSRRGRLIPLKRAIRYARHSKTPYKMPDHIEIVSLLKERDMLPALYFLFSRKRVEEFARELSKSLSLVDRAEERRIKKALKGFQVDPELMPFYRRIQPLLVRGIGFHHAGLLPGIKRMVEVLFERRLLKVVYCTSTFALGINMPARTVCLDTVFKFDGERIRPLKNIEFFQKAGRAGRRGIDEKGFVVVRFDERDMDSIPFYDERKVEPIESSFKLSYNSIVNLLRRESFDDMLKFLASSFWSFQKERWKKESLKELERLKKELEALPRFECKYSQDLYEERLEYLRKRVEVLRSKLSSIREGLKSNISDRKKRRLFLKERNTLRELSKREKELSTIRLELCEFCENRLECMKIERKRAQKARRIEMLEASLKRVSEHLRRELEGKINVLKDMGYVDGNLSLLVGGKVSSKIHIEELVTTEIILEGIVGELSPESLVALFACIVRGGDKGGTKPKTLPRKLRRDVNDIVSYVSGIEMKHLERPETQGVNWGFWEVASLWAKGEPVKRITDRLGMYEGDVISCLKQAKDLLTQIKRAYEMELSKGPLSELTKIREAIELIDRPFLKEFSD